MAQQTPLPKDDEAVQLKQAVDSATAELRRSLQQEHDRAEALATELAKVRQAVEQKPAPDRSATGSVKPDEPARVEHKPRGGYGCQRFRTYDPASGTYTGYDGRRHSCP
jgi:hypothetical protein